MAYSNLLVSNKVSNIKHKLEGWREVLLPLASLLRWDEPYYPFIIAGTTTFLFSTLWYTEISTLTAISLACLLVGIFDFCVPFVGSIITGTSIWTNEEESEFIYICQLIADVYDEVVETCQGLSVLRHENSKVFFFIMVGVLTAAAWVGSVVSNFFLTYLFVTGVLLTPGMRFHGLVHNYTQSVVRTFSKLNINFFEKSKFS